MTIVITGASQGIGYAIAENYAREIRGAKIAMCARNPEEIAQAGTRLREVAPDTTVLTSVCDVANERSVEGFGKRVHAEFGPVDILVMNAGYGVFKPIDRILESEFDGVIATNLRGAFLTAKAFLPMMLERKSGTIVAIASLAGKNGFVGGGAYCASKFGLRGLMQSLFLDVRDKNIRVITLFPGSVDTGFFKRNDGDAIRSRQALSPNDVAECVFHATMLPVGATVSELDLRPTNPLGT
jgi:3-oxoacyl-[acyl-carrier protein] reductase